MIDEFNESFKQLIKYGKPIYKKFKYRYKELCEDIYLNYDIEEAMKSCDFDY